MRRDSAGKPAGCPLLPRIPHASSQEGTTNYRVRSTLLVSGTWMENHSICMHLGQCILANDSHQSSYLCPTLDPLGRKVFDCCLPSFRGYFVILSPQTPKIGHLSLAVPPSLPPCSNNSSTILSPLFTLSGAESFPLLLWSRSRQMYYPVLSTSPLPRPSFVRLVQLRSAASMSDPLEFEFPLRDRHLMTSLHHSFDAISYVWGDSIIAHQIVSLPSGNASR